MAKSRRKGKVGELAAAEELRRLFGVEARRGQQFHGGGDSPDVVTSIAGVHLEVKRCEALSLYTAVDQAVADAGEKVPVVLHRRNHKPWVAIVRLDDLPKLAAQLYLTMTENK
jgi:hypothetical protein